MSIIGIAHAETNAAPFGLEVGAASYTQLKTQYGSNTNLIDAGVNQFTHGRMVESDGSGFDVDGIHKILFVFDKSDVLSGVIITMPKDPAGTFKMLSGKYKPVTNKIDGFMNNGYAKLKKGNSFIEIDAPHMSFTMEVRYLTNDFMSSYLKSVNDENKEKQKKRATAL